MDDATNKPADHVATATQETDADKPGRGFLDVLAEAVAIKEAGHMPGPASDGTEVPGAVRAPGAPPRPDSSDYGRLEARARRRGDHQAAAVWERLKLQSSPAMTGQSHTLVGTQAPDQRTEKAPMKSETDGLRLSSDQLLLAKQLSLAFERAESIARRRLNRLVFAWLISWSADVPDWPQIPSRLKLSPKTCEYSRKDRHADDLLFSRRTASHLEGRMAGEIERFLGLVSIKESPVSNREAQYSDLWFEVDIVILSPQAVGSRLHTFDRVFNAQILDFDPEGREGVMRTHGAPCPVLMRVKYSHAAEARAGVPLHPGQTVKLAAEAPTEPETSDRFEVILIG